MWSYVLGVIGITGLYLAPRWPRFGWCLNIGAQVLWAVYAIATKQWGFLATAAAYTFVYVRLLRRAVRSADSAAVQPQLSNQSTTRTSPGSPSLASMSSRWK